MNIKEWIKMTLFNKSGNVNSAIARRSWWDKRGFTDYYNTIMSRTEFLTDCSWAERIYCILNDITSVPTCPTCTNPVNYSNRNHRYSSYCSKLCANRNPAEQQKRRDRVNELYGVDNVMRVQELVAKISQTKLTKYGTTSYNNIQKRNQTCMNKYGTTNYVDTAEFKTKSANTLMANFGVTNPMESEELIIKQHQTMIDRYGVKYAAQHPALFNKILKSGYKLKEYVFDSGRVALVQGYEPLALDKLLKEGILESDIITNNIPSIPYKYDSKERLYHPDIYIKSSNTIVEVKSHYTYYADKDVNDTKLKAAEQAGFNVRLMIMG